MEELSNLTLARALAKSKRVEEQIIEAVNDASNNTFSVCKGDRKEMSPQHVSVDAFMKKAKAADQRVKDLIAFRNKLRACIHRTNVLTSIKTAAGEMTISEAVEYRNTMHLEEELISARMKCIAEINRKIETSNVALDSAIEAAASAASQGQMSEEVYKMVEAPRRASGQCYLVDPLGLCNSLSVELSNLRDRRVELDFTLSEANARTFLIVSPA